MPQAVAQAMGVSTSSQSAPDALKGHLAGDLHAAPTLLFLDSFEHLLGAVPFVADLLAIEGPLKILVTSREPLHLYGEHEVPVLPLPRPDPLAHDLARHSGAQSGGHAVCGTGDARPSPTSR